MNKNAVLFDLDGTILDTAPDIVYALNQLRKKYHQSELVFERIRPYISLGSKAMLEMTLGIHPNDHNFNEVREEFFMLYQEHIANATTFFPGMESVLTHLEKRLIPWGIVTNKLTRHAEKLLKILKLDHKAACIICGDTLTKYKPDPEPILHACGLIQCDPKECVYIGDSNSDVLASKTAGTKSLVALYGYIQSGDDPFSWQADGYIKKPVEIIDWIENVF